MEPYYPGHRVRCYIFAGGALFEATGTTQFYADTDDFDASGEFLYYLVTPGIICHNMEVADEE